MTKPTLKPCPFCGSSITIDEISEEDLNIYDEEQNLIVSIECDNCQASIGYSDSESMAVEKWNARAESEKYNKLLEFVKRIHAGFNFNDRRHSLNYFVYLKLEVENLLKEIGEAE